MLLITLTAGVLAAGPQNLPPLRSGDIVLQATQSGVADTIQRATSSQYSHAGIVDIAADGAYVIEAIEPVSRTPFEVWRSRGKGGHLTVMRPHLKAAALAATVEAARHDLGKPYDTHYTWDDDKLYCSELVVKAFERGAHVELGKRVRLDSLNFTPDERAMAAMMGVPMSQEVVTPASLAEDPHLECIFNDMQ
jgi:uncharacterized protein YycO